MAFCPDLFMSDTNSAFLYSDGQQRYGQFLINQFIQKYPEIVIPQEADCFYDDKKVGDFLRFIYETAIFKTAA